MSTIQQQFQQRPHPTEEQGYAAPQHQVIKPTSNLQTPTAGNQNMQRLQTIPNTTKDLVKRRCFNYGETDHYAHVCSNYDHTPIECRQPTHLPIEVPTLFSWLLSRTLLEEESTKWLLKKLRMPQWMLHSSSTHIPFWSFLDQLPFLLWESRGEILLRGVVLSHPKILNFGMWLKFINFSKPFFSIDYNLHL
jgi:hypothetical protein